MEEKDFLTYKKFTYKGEATELADLLNANNIENLFEDTSAVFDLTFTDNELKKEYRVKLKPSDFGMADKLLYDISAKEINEVDKDYYVFKFSNEELIDVLTRSDEWSPFNYLLAQKILKDRGQEVNEQLLETLKEKRNKELAQPDENKKSGIITGYVLSFLGGVLGIFIGWSLLSTKKTLPNGKSVFANSKEDREHGKRILMLGIIFLLIWTVIITW